MSTLRQQNKELYWAWKAMKQRTQNPKCQAYKNYGARGITICDEWQKFEPFLEWAKSNGYEQGLELDRKNNDSGYSPGNCRWVTRRENVNNRRVTLYFTVNGETKPCSDWAAKTHIPRSTLKIWKRKKGKTYVEQRIKQALLEGYKPCDYSRGNTKKIRLVDTGKVYNSVREAAEDNGMHSCNISTAMTCKNGQTKVGKFEWEEI